MGGMNSHVQVGSAVGWAVVGALVGEAVSKGVVPVTTASVGGKVGSTTTALVGGKVGKVLFLSGLASLRSRFL